MESKKRLRNTVEDHLVNKNQFIVDLFEALRTEIGKLKNVEENAVDPYIGYQVRSANKRAILFVELHVQQTKIVLHLRKTKYKNFGTLIIRDAPDRHRWTLSKLVDICDNTELINAMSLIEQSYNDVL